MAAEEFTSYLVSFDINETDKETAEQFSGKKFESYGALAMACPDSACVWKLANFCVSANNEEISLSGVWLANVYVKIQKS